MSESSELLRAYLADKSEAAFQALVARYLPLVYATALRRVGGNTTLAEEVSQDVFIVLARKGAALVDRPTITPWLFNTTWLSAVNRLRSEQRRLEREHKAYAMDDRATELDEIDWERTRPLLDSLLGKLSGRDRDALFMRYFEGRTFAEIGAQLNISEDGARLRSTRALDKINSLLSRRGIRSTSAVLAEVLMTQHAGALPAGLVSSTISAAFSSVPLAAGGFATAALILPIMNTSQIVVGSLAVLAILGMGSAFYIAQTARRDHAAIEALRQERVALQREVAALHGRLQSETATLAAVQSDRDALRAAYKTPVAPTSAAKPSSPAPNASAPSSIAELLNQIDYVLAHPELRPAFVRQVVQQLTGNDQRFFKSIGVSAEQEQAIRKEASDYANTLLNARANRIGGEDFVDLFSAADDYSFNQVKRILGDDVFGQLKQFKTRARENTTVDQLAVQLYTTDSPLTGQQAGVLTQILVQNRFSADPVHAGVTSMVAGRAVSDAEYNAFREAQGAQPGAPRAALVTDAALAQARGVLPAGTVDALKALQDRQITQIQLLPSLPRK